MINLYIFFSGFFSKDSVKITVLRETYKDASAICIYTWIKWKNKTMLISERFLVIFWIEYVQYIEVGNVFVSINLKIWTCSLKCQSFFT